MSSAHCSITGAVARARGPEPWHPRGRHASPATQAKALASFITQATNIFAASGIGWHEHHAQTLGSSSLGPDLSQIGPWDLTEHTGPIAGITITTAAATVLHATQTAQRLLQHPVTGLALQLGQETHAAGILLPGHSLRSSTVAVGPGGGAKQVRHRTVPIVRMVCSVELCKNHLGRQS